ncbi:hypothetical protein [Synechococcus elongatus]|uniref:hypothetical protein n=1 Tax=Synechococcus elongatus TaxID=32046 RepID=UPI000F7E3357|nr:hypothetical protein [Synechococcus elongatus]
MLTPVDFATFSQAAGLPYPSSAEEQARLTPAVMQWKQQREEQRRNEVLSTIGLGLLGAGVLGGAGYAGYQYLGRDRKAAQAQAAVDAIAPPAAPPIDQAAKNRQDAGSAIAQGMNLINPDGEYRPNAWAATINERPYEQRDRQGSIPAPFPRLTPGSFYDQEKQQEVQMRLSDEGYLPAVDERGFVNAGPLNRRSDWRNINSPRNNLIDLYAEGRLDEINSFLTGLIKKGQESRAVQLMNDLVVQMAADPANIKQGKLDFLNQIAGRLSKNQFEPGRNELVSASSLVNNFFRESGGQLIGQRPEPSTSRATDRVGFQMRQKLIRDNELGLGEFLQMQFGDNPPPEIQKRIQRMRQGSDVLDFGTFLEGNGIRVDDQEAVRIALALENSDYLAGQAPPSERLTDTDIQMRRSIVEPRISVKPVMNIDGTTSYEKYLYGLRNVNVNGTTQTVRVPLGRVIEEENALGQKERLLEYNGRTVVLPEVDLSEAIELTKGDTRGVETVTETPNTRLILVSNNQDSLFPAVGLTIEKAGQSGGVSPIFLIKDREPNDDYTEFFTESQAARTSNGKLYTGYEQAWVDDLGRLRTVNPGQLDVLAKQYYLAQASGDQRLAQQKKQALVEFANTYAQGELMGNSIVRGAAIRAGRAAKTAPLNLAQPYIAEAIDAAIGAYGMAPNLTMSGLLKESVRRLAAPKMVLEADARSTVPYGLLSPLQAAIESGEANNPQVLERVRAETLAGIDDFYNKVYDLGAAGVWDSFQRGKVKDADTPWGRDYLALQSYLERDGAGYVTSSVSNPRGLLFDRDAAEIDADLQAIAARYANTPIGEVIGNSKLSRDDKIASLSSLYDLFRVPRGATPDQVEARRSRIPRDADGNLLFNESAISSAIDDIRGVSRAVRVSEYDDSLVATILRDNSTTLGDKAQMIAGLRGRQDVNQRAVAAAIAGLENRAKVVPFIAADPQGDSRLFEFAELVNQRKLQEATDAARGLLPEIGYAFEQEGGESVVRRDAIDTDADPMLRLLEGDDDPPEFGPVIQRRPGFLGLKEDRGTLPSALRKWFQAKNQRPPQRDPLEGLERVPAGAIVTDYENPAAEAVRAELAARRWPSPVDSVLADEVFARRQQQPVFEATPAPAAPSVVSRDAVRSAVEKAIQDQIAVQMREPIAREIIFRGRRP